MTEYSPVFAQSEPFAIHLPNVVNSVYTGIEYVTASLTFYGATASYPAPTGIPGTILPLTSTANWAFDGGVSPPSMSPFTLPNNAVSLTLELWAKGNSCDEFWYASEPTAYANANGLCSGGAFREVQVFIDGTLAGAVFPFPYIFTGGVNPPLWRPIPAVDAFNEPAYYVDLSPFVGELVKGQPHTISLAVVNNGYYWQLGGSLLVNGDSGQARTTGALTTYSILPGAVNSTTQTIGAKAATFDVTASRDYTLAGSVNTSAGQVMTTVTSDLPFTSHQTLSLVDFTENVKGSESAQASISVATPTTTTVTTTTDTYPITLIPTFAIPQGAYDPNANPPTARFLLPVSVSRAWERQVTITVNGVTVFSSSFSDSVQASAVLEESLITGGAGVATGSDSESYVYSDSTRACYHHDIAASQGYVTHDTYPGNR